MKKKNYDDNFKRIVIGSIKEKCKFSPIPEVLVNDEITKNWNSYLMKLGKNEKDFLKGNVDAKTNFYDNNRDQALETVKITLVLESIVKKYNIITNEKEVEEHIKDLSKMLSYDDDKTNKMLNASMTNKRQYKLMEKMKLNEKAIDFVVNMFKK